jgi:hypothetical protein
VAAILELDDGDADVLHGTSRFRLGPRRFGKNKTITHTQTGQQKTAGYPAVFLTVSSVPILVILPQANS